MQPQRSFALNAKKLLLTYSNCESLTKEEVLEHFKSHEATLYAAIVAREIAPSTLLPHIHGYFIFRTPYRTKTRSSLLVRGYGVNIAKVGSSAKDHAQLISYLRKDGDFLEFGLD